MERSFVLDVRPFGNGKSATTGPTAWFLQAGAFTPAETLAHAVLILFESHGEENVPPFEIRRVYEGATRTPSEIHALEEDVVRDTASVLERGADNVIPDAFPSTIHPWAC